MRGVRRPGHIFCYFQLVHANRKAVQPTLEAMQGCTGVGELKALVIPKPEAPQKECS